MSYPNGSNGLTPTPKRSSSPTPSQGSNGADESKDPKKGGATSKIMQAIKGVSKSSSESKSTPSSSGTDKVEKKDKGAKSKASQFFDKLRGAEKSKSTFFTNVDSTSTSERTETDTSSTPQTPQEIKVNLIRVQRELALKEQDLKNLEHSISQKQEALPTLQEQVTQAIEKREEKAAEAVGLLKTTKKATAAEAAKAAFQAETKIQLLLSSLINLNLSRERTFKGLIALHKQKTDLHKVLRNIESKTLTELQEEANTVEIIKADNEKLKKPDKSVKTDCEKRILELEIQMKGGEEKIEELNMKIKEEKDERKRLKDLKQLGKAELEKLRQEVEARLNSWTADAQALPERAEERHKIMQAMSAQEAKYEKDRLAAEEKAQQQKKEAEEEERRLNIERAAQGLPSIETQEQIENIICAREIYTRLETAQARLTEASALLQVEDALLTEAQSNFTKAETELNKVKKSFNI